jgi:hypothetical protein
MIQPTAAVVCSFGVGGALASDEVAGGTSSYISGGSSESTSHDGSKGYHIENEETVVENDGRWLFVVVIYEDDS